MSWLVIAAALGLFAAGRRTNMGEGYGFAQRNAGAILDAIQPRTGVASVPVFMIDDGGDQAAGGSEEEATISAEQIAAAMAATRGQDSAASRTPMQIITKLSALDARFHFLSHGLKFPRVEQDDFGEHFTAHKAGRRQQVVTAMGEALYLGRDPGAAKGAPMLRDRGQGPSLRGDFELYCATYSILPSEAATAAASTEARESHPGLGDRLFGALGSLLSGSGAAISAGIIGAFGGGYTGPRQTTRRAYSPEESRLLTWMRTTLCAVPRVEGQYGQPVWTTGTDRRKSHYLTTVAHALSGDIPLKHVLELVGGVVAFETAVGISEIRDGDSWRPTFSNETAKEYATPGALLLRCVLLARTYTGLLSPDPMSGPNGLAMLSLDKRTRASLILLSHLVEDAEPTMLWLEAIRADFISQEGDQFGDGTGTPPAGPFQSGPRAEGAEQHIAPRSAWSDLLGGVLGIVSPFGAQWVDLSSVSGTRRYLVPQVYSSLQLKPGA